MLAAVAALVAVPALAGDHAATPIPQTPPVQARPMAMAAANHGPKTGAEVKAERARARAGGELSRDPNSPAYPQRYAMDGYAAPRVRVAKGFFHAVARTAAPATPRATVNRVAVLARPSLDPSLCSLPLV
ncbi:hypothetical protein [Paraburkholderia lycopersici]|uniref:Uncharacterized protein n=1 Tax=Paraburkholderia lycopersici TaxID=416944 RepID=A0A1G6H1J3_9BURK|nr:hypothetical protein [Paraburkholderia lycopersici]SDB87256.1 hypothetical protein SAMN05421548_101494 [Paraburkholderia lycopersici]